MPKLTFTKGMLRKKVKEAPMQSGAKTMTKLPAQKMSYGRKKGKKG